MNIFSKITHLCKWHITFKVGDVLPARISETAGFAGQAKCGVAKCRRGRSPNGVLWNPKMPYRHFCASRVLCDGQAYTIIPKYIILYTLALKQLLCIHIIF